MLPPFALLVPNFSLSSTPSPGQLHSVVKKKMLDLLH